MHCREIRDGVFAVGAIDWDRRLFDELIPLPDGTSYNAYLIKGRDRVALLDTVDPAKEPELLCNLKELGISHLDYIVAHHGEQDHSGAIPAVLKHYPMARVVTNPKCKNILIEHLKIREDLFVQVDDRAVLDLGGRILEFIIAPWVHWPETMLSYLREEKILFTCDLFGSHLATSELYSIEEARVYESAKRYYAEIMMPFRTSIQGHLKRLQGYALDIIAPSHGPVHNRPAFITGAYQDWTSDQVKNEVVLPYVSMHGSVNRMAAILTDELMRRNIRVMPFNLTRTDLGELAIALVDAATIVIGAPTVLGGPHPAAVYAAYLANALRPKTRFASIIGSYGWGSRMVEVLKGLLGNLKVEMIDPVVIKGLPGDDDRRALAALADQIERRHKTL